MRTVPLILICLIKMSLADKPAIAVLDMEGNGMPAADANGLSGRLRSEMFNRGTFTVLERSEIDEVLKEQSFQQTGCTNSECAIEIGRLVGVRYVVIGQFNKMSTLYSSDIRMIDVETGTLFKSVAIDCEGCSIKDVLRDMIPKIVEQLSLLSSQSEVGSNGTMSIVSNEKKTRIRNTSIPFIIAGYVALAAGIPFGIIPIADSDHPMSIFAGLIPTWGTAAICLTIGHGLYAKSKRMTVSGKSRSDMVIEAGYCIEF